MEESVPEDSPEGWIPMLDTKMKIEREGGITKVRHTYYRKPMASMEVTWARSALSSKQKRDILIQDLTRRLRNCDRQVSQKEK